MGKVQHTFSNCRDGTIYVSVEPWPECFELEPGEKLTLIWHAPENGDAMQIEFLNERELVVWPHGAIDEMKYLINGKEAERTSWNFKHK